MKCLQRIVAHFRSLHLGNTEMEQQDVGFFFLGIPKPDTSSMSIAKPFYVLALTFAGCYGTTLYNDDKP